MRLFILILFFITRYFFAIGQDCKGFEKNSVSSSEYIEIVSSKPLEKRSEEHIQKIKDLLKKDLQLLMSEAILTEVKGETNHLVTESNGEFSEFFQSQMKIETSTSLGFASVEFCEDRDAKIVWGKYRINRLELASATMQNCLSKMTALNAEIQGVIYSESKIDVQTIKNKYLSIYRDFNSAIYLNPNLNTEKWQSLIQSYNKEMGRLSNSQDQVEFDSEFDLAKKKLKAGSYYDAIVILNRLKVDHFNNEELNHTLDNAIAEYEIFVLRKVGEQRNQRDFAGGIVTLSNFCGIVTCNDRVLKLRDEISKLYLKEEVEKFKMAIKYDEPENVEKLKRNIDKFQDYDIDLYKEVSEEYNDFHIRLGMKQVLTNTAKEDYWAAYGVIKELENRYGKRDNELMRLKSNVERRILRNEVKEEKSRRPKMMSIWLGTDLTFNQVELDSINKYSIESYFFTYSMGVYWKFRFESNYRKSYPVRSDFIGVRFRMLDYGSSRNIPGEVNTGLGFVKSRRPQYDVGLDGYAFRVLHYGLSLNLDERSKILAPNYYQATLGLRIPIFIFSWITDVNVITRLAGEGRVNVSSGLCVRLDYMRKFSRKDKLRIRAERFS
jgi:hypothetical protein